MIWYPYEQMKTMKAPYKIVDAEGVYLYTEDQKLIDSVSSWWSVIHGYKHPELNRAIISQAEKFSHVMLGGLTHEPVQRLAEKLKDFLPGDLDYSFFSDSGSVAVEVALKMALQFYMNRGDEQRTMIITAIPSKPWRPATTRIIILCSMPTAPANTLCTFQRKFKLWSRHLRNTADG